MAKIGDLVWCVERDEFEDATDASGYIFVAGNEKCAVVASNPVGYAGDICDYLIEETRKELQTTVYVFPNEDVFATRKEAMDAAGLI